MPLRCINALHSYDWDIWLHVLMSVFEPGKHWWRFVPGFLMSDVLWIISLVDEMLSCLKMKGNLWYM